MNNIRNILLNKWKKLTIQLKLILIFMFTSFIIFVVMFFMYLNINSMIQEIDKVYVSNVNLNELSKALQNVNDSMADYLNTKSSDSIEYYYRNEQDFQNLLSTLNTKVVDNDLLLMEKNIRNMSEDYLTVTNETVQAKRGRNIEKYSRMYEEACDLFSYINTYIFSLNNEQFKSNSNNYKVLMVSLQYLEYISASILGLVTVANIILIIMLTRSITSPLMKLAKTANEVAEGNLDVTLVHVDSMDEVGILSRAFSKMILSIRNYIEQIKEKMETESALKEKELIMKGHLKDAQLKYLQAQINPHFLFNTLNAGAQLAMMEGADKTCLFVENMAAFFRYNVKKINQDATIKEEIKLVDSYIYIMNVRFSGEINYQKEIDESLLNIRIPSMVLQPLVENAVNYGIRNISWEGIIQVSVYRKSNKICISVKDNGIGLEENIIENIMNGEEKETDLLKNSTGIGLDNVISRLKLYYDSDDVFDIRSEGLNKGVEVLIYIPDEVLYREEYNV